MDWSTGSMRQMKVDTNAFGMGYEYTYDTMFDSSTNKLHFIYKSTGSTIRYTTKNLNLDNGTFTNDTDTLVVDLDPANGYLYNYEAILYAGFIKKDNSGNINVAFAIGGTKHVSATAENPKIIIKEPTSLTFKMIVDSAYISQSAITSQAGRIYDILWIEKYQKFYAIDGYGNHGDENVIDLDYTNTLNKVSSVSCVESVYGLTIRKNFAQHKEEAMIGGWDYNNGNTSNAIWQFTDANTVVRVKTMGNDSMIVGSYGYTDQNYQKHFFYKDFLYGSSGNNNMYREYIYSGEQPPGKTIFEYEFGEIVGKFVSGVNKYFEISGNITKEHK